MENSIPVVDFTSVSGIDKFNLKGDVEKVGKCIVSAFEDIGFVYLKNTGITQDYIDAFNATCLEFFNLPSNIKQECARPSDSYHGYICGGIESVEEGRPPDLRESFMLSPGASNLVWPDESHAPMFKQAMEQMYSDFKQLAVKILQVLSVGLKCQDIDFFTNGHKCMGRVGSATSLRVSHYPPIPDNVIPNQIRCGEHSDYGTITLLCQDDAGGLQVKARNGVYIDAAPMANTILVNIGDSLMRWSGDRFISTKHRVIIPESELIQRKLRQSCVFFVTPDDDYIIKSFGGGSKYDPIRAGDYLHSNFHHNFDRQQ